MSELGNVCQHGSLARACLICELQSQLSQVQGENADLKEHNEEMRKAIRDVNDKLTERDALKAEIEQLKWAAKINTDEGQQMCDCLQKEVQRLRDALQHALIYIDAINHELGVYKRIPREQDAFILKIEQALASQGE